MVEGITILVLGASRYQVPVIARARERGFCVITTDNAPSNPGHALADRAYAVDTTDVQGVLAIASREQVTGIVAPCTDIAIPTLAAVASRLGLRGPSPEAAAILCDKIRFRSWLAENDLPAPICVPVDAWPGDGTWVLKPDRSSGSKGIFLVRSEDELVARLPETLMFSRRALLDAFVPGEQLTCEGLLRDGELIAHWVTSRQTAPAPYVATWGHILPSRVGTSADDAALAAVVGILKRLGVSDGPFDADVVWDGARAWVLEATPRLGGNSLARLIKIASGVNLIDEALSYAVGEPFGRTHSARLRATAVLLLGVDRSGTLQYDERAVASLAAEPWVVSIEMDRRPGATVEPFINGRHRLGEVLVIADDSETLEQRCHDVRSRLQLSIAEENVT